MEKINDKRLTPTMDLARSGKIQLFREKNPKDRTFIGRDNCDVLLEHKNKEMYAELINGEWFWVSGCAECNGKPRDWMTYVECEKHDRCSVCYTPRKDIKEKSVWGNKTGWICNTCHNEEVKDRKKAAFDKIKEKEIDCSYTDQIICPHCGSDLSSDDVYENQDMQCYVCDGELSVEVEYTASYSTTIKGKRIKK